MFCSYYLPSTTLLIQHRIETTPAKDAFQEGMCTIQNKRSLCLYSEVSFPPSVLIDRPLQHSTYKCISSENILSSVGLACRKFVQVFSLRIHPLTPRQCCQSNHLDLFVEKRQRNKGFLSAVLNKNIFFKNSGGNIPYLLAF